ncbi:MAG: penicillin-binding protein 2 [Pseudomonadota bacterium]
MTRRLEETELDRTNLFRRRAFLLGGLQLAAFGVLGGRLYQLSVLEGEDYRLLADDNRLSLRFLAPLRGRITDFEGRELASNKRDFSVVVVPEQVDNLGETLSQLSKVLPISAAERETVLSRARRQRSFLPIRIKDNMTWDDFARFNAAAAYLPGVFPAAGTSRIYPHASDAAHVLGYVGAVAQKDLTGDPVLNLPNFKIGKEGVERSFETHLRGQAGTQRVEVNARGRVVREVAREEPAAGAELRLTLDQRLQSFAAQRMGEESAGIVVMDVDSGDVRALVSTPAYDPNDFVDGISHTNWSSLLADPRKPLINKALSGQYPPGSTFKMIVALAALEAGVITPETTFFCGGHVNVGNQRFHCWKRFGHGKLDLAGAIAESCDVYFYEIAKELGQAKIVDMAKRFGLGQTYGLPIPGEKAGLVPTPEWKKRARGVSWVGGDTVNMSIGQGALLSTPLQLATMTARLVNGGRPVEPRLVISPEEDVQPGAAVTQMSTPLVAAEHLETIKSAMLAVVNSKRGTARASALPDDLGQMGGKTGTAQVRRISQAERETGVLENDVLAWRERDHALFVGFAPADKPRYAVAVLVQHGGGGSTVAAPVASDILAKALELDLERVNQASADRDQGDLARAERKDRGQG